MIAVIDYGMGNLHSVENALHKIACPCVITRHIEDIRNAEKLILPGVGAFPDCMKRLHELGLYDVLREEVLQKKKPILGICLGMQAFFEESEEGGLSKGLGFLQGRIVKMHDADVRIPHIGWNMLEANRAHTLWQCLSEHPYMYFVHSYYAQAYQPKDVLAYVGYGALNIVSLIQKDHILGAQFHPEKSGEDGLRILTYFKEEFV